MTSDGRGKAQRMAENSNMQISRAPKLEWNLNTIIQLFTLVGMVVGGVAIWVVSATNIPPFLLRLRPRDKLLHR